MSKAFWLVMMIMICAGALMVINLVQSYTTEKEADYYLLKDTTEAAMVDAIDFAYLRVSGDIKINKEIFIESFTRRFATSVDSSNDYIIEFYSINELPPKVSVKVSGNTNASFTSETFTTISLIDAILETPYEDWGAILPRS